VIGIVSTLAIHPIGKKDACIENMPVTMHVASFGSTKAARTDGRTRLGGKRLGLFCCTLCPLRLDWMLAGTCRLQG
jgi:hypothetical protein